MISIKKNSLSNIIIIFLIIKKYLTSKGYTYKFNKFLCDKNGKYCIDYKI